MFLHIPLSQSSNKQTRTIFMGFTLMLLFLTVFSVNIYKHPEVLCEK